MKPSWLPPRHRVVHFKLFWEMAIDLPPMDRFKSCQLKFDDAKQDADWGWGIPCAQRTSMATYIKRRRKLSGLLRERGLLTSSTGKVGASIVLDDIHRNADGTTLHTSEDLEEIWESYCSFVGEIGTQIVYETHCGVSIDALRVRYRISVLTARLDMLDTLIWSTAQHCRLWTHIIEYWSGQRWDRRISLLNNIYLWASLNSDVKAVSLVLEDIEWIM